MCVCMYARMYVWQGSSDTLDKQTCVCMYVCVYVCMYLYVYQGSSDFQNRR